MSKDDKPGQALPGSQEGPRGPEQLLLSPTSAWRWGDSTHHLCCPLWPLGTSSKATLKWREGGALVMGGTGEEQTWWCPGPAAASWNLPAPHRRLPQTTPRAQDHVFPLDFILPEVLPRVSPLLVPGTTAVLADRHPAGPFMANFEGLMGRRGQYLNSCGRAQSRGLPLPSCPFSCS